MFFGLGGSKSIDHLGRLRVPRHHCSCHKENRAADGKPCPGPEVVEPNGALEQPDCNEANKGRGATEHTSELSVAPSNADSDPYERTQNRNEKPENDKPRAREHRQPPVECGDTMHHVGSAQRVSWS